MEAIKSISKSSTKYLLKTLAATSITLNSSSSSSTILECSDLINASCQIWKLRDWLEIAEDEQGELLIFVIVRLADGEYVFVELAAFCQLSLSHVLQLFSSTSAIEHPRALKTCMTMLNLLSFRITRLRIDGKGKILSTLPFETFLACHLRFRAGLRSNC